MLSVSGPRLLLITNTIQDAPVGGRELLCKLNRDALADVYGPRLRVVELAKRPISLAQVLGALRGNIDGLNAETMAGVLATIREEHISKVFVDGSNLGQVVRAIKAEFPEVEVFTFFHNVEVRFFLGAMKQSPSLRALAVLMANYVAEKASVRLSDSIICMNERDSALLRKVYGRGATHISPMAMHDRLPTAATSDVGADQSKYALFVGGTFYANLAGIAWFCQNVAPHISIKTCVLGKGFHAFKDELERHGNVEVIGEVEKLAPWYVHAHVVVAPIFDGSGMKTKVAEALMFGKRVIGTPEAFSGYEDVARSVGVICETADDFVRAIQAEMDCDHVAFDLELRSSYEKRYSFAAARARIAAILGEIDCRAEAGA